MKLDDKQEKLLEEARKLFFEISRTHKNEAVNARKIFGIVKELNVPLRYLDNLAIMSDREVELQLQGALQDEFLTASSWAEFLQRNKNPNAQSQVRS